MSVHKQVWTKVNAHVDIGIVGVVEALNMFPLLQTIESCEGTGGRPWVCFSYGESEQQSWREVAEFTLGIFAPLLFEKVGDAAGVTLRPTVSGLVLVELTVRPEGLKSVQKAIYDIAMEFTRGHNSACFDGMSDKGL